MLMEKHINSIDIERWINAAKGKKIAIVNTQWNPQYINSMTNSAVETFKIAGLTDEDIAIFTVPGAFEIPLVAKQLARKYDGVVTIGCVIKGDTPHFDYVCKAVTEGLVLAINEVEKPITFGIITVNTVQQAKERSIPNATSNKGFEAASALLDLFHTLNEIK